MSKVKEIGSVVLRLQGVALNIRALHVEKYNNKYVKINSRFLEQLKTLRKDINFWVEGKQ